MKPDLRKFMTGKRLLVTGIAAAAVAAGTAGTALAAGGGHGDGDRPEKAPAVTADQAMGAALKAVPGTVGEADLDDGAWEIDVLAGDGAWHEVKIDASNAKVTADQTGKESDAAEAQGLKNTKVTAQQAAATALKSASGAVTSVELEHEGDKPAWEVEVAGQDGTEHELLVDGATGTVTKNKAEHDDHGKKDGDGKKQDEGKKDDGKQDGGEDD
ncbi:PepSY domain-containing protein [Actinomadura violacea]|uniref:PepSY domain-containing protein n=1 Tax=Actinomadura violacea TaxID=2819934 RepID=A0ABS3RP74_9ACTN|nr:PepSY domain-containing protein [Actinomadura violacea]MBO2457854.1 PepSY domain-containing protein [Actinomadura violacea]